MMATELNSQFWQMRCLDLVKCIEILVCCLGRVAFC